MNFSILFAKFLNLFTHLSEHYHKDVKTLAKFRTRYDAFEGVLILKSIKYCDLWEKPNYILFLENIPAQKSLNEN